MTSDTDPSPLAGWSTANRLAAVRGEGWSQTGGTIRSEPNQTLRASAWMRADWRLEQKKTPPTAIHCAWKKGHQVVEAAWESQTRKNYRPLITGQVSRQWWVLADGHSHERRGMTEIGYVGGEAF